LDSKNWARSARISKTAPMDYTDSTSAYSNYSFDQGNYFTAIKVGLHLRIYCPIEDADYF
jgi:hypothetical protein